MTQILMTTDGGKNMSYEVVVESTCDLNAEHRSKFGVYPEVIRGFVYIPGKEEFLADTEFSNYTPEAFFKLVKAKAGKIHTAFAPFQEFVRVVEPILKDGKDAIILTISSGISGTYNGFLNWAGVLLEDYPERKIEIIDSLKYSSAAGLLAIYAVENRNKGMSFEDNVKWLNENRYRLHEAGPMDDLTFLARNGRISGGKAFFGQLAGVQPFGDFTRDGKNAPLGTLKGETKTNEVSLQYMLKLADKIEDQIIVIAHSVRAKRAEEFKKQLLAVAKPRDVIITHVGESCGPNMGPGLCAYFFMGSPITDTREKELALFSELKGK